MVRHPTKSLKQAATFLLRESETTDSLLTLDGRGLRQGARGDLRNSRVLQLCKILRRSVQATPLRFGVRQLTLSIIVAIRIYQSTARLFSRHKK